MTLSSGPKSLWERLALPRLWPRPAAAAAAPAGRFTEASWGQASERNGRRRYWLYQPSKPQPGLAPLVLMLHGCQQDALQFAAATRMNNQAEAAGAWVLYPEQSVAAHSLRCWNWYGGAGGHGRSSVLDLEVKALLTLLDQVLGHHALDRRRVYLAGLSAGGAMAVLLASHRPQRFAALAVHSGVLPSPSLDVFAALRLMASGPDPDSSAPLPVLHLPTLVFHGDADTVVAPANGLALHAASAAGQTGADWVAQVQPSRNAQGQLRHGYTRQVQWTADGVTRRELWLIHGAGHAWSGGGEGLPFSDPAGPDASAEMLRFFLQHHRP